VRREVFGRRSKRSTFSAPSRFNLIFLARVRQTRDARFADSAKLHPSLELIPQSLLMPVRLHAFAALVLGNLCFPSFFKRAHSGF
jgi:hypothetical protein